MPLHVRIARTLLFVFHLLAGPGCDFKPLFVVNLSSIGANHRGTGSRCGVTTSATSLMRKRVWYPSLFHHPPPVAFRSHVFCSHASGRQGGPDGGKETGTETRAFAAAMTGLMQVMHLETRSGARTLVLVAT